MKYLGPLRVISNTAIDKIKNYIDIGRTIIGTQKNTVSPNVNQHYRNTVMPDGTIVETWYHYEYHTVKVTVPEGPEELLEKYIPGIIMLPMDDSAIWGYTNPVEGILGEVVTTKDDIRYGSSLLVAKYNSEDSTYKQSEIIRPWKQPTIDPKTKTKSYQCGQIAYPVYSDEAKTKYVGNVVFPRFRKGQAGLEYTQNPTMTLWNLSTDLKESEEMLDTTDGYKLHETIKNNSIEAVSLKGDHVIILGEDPSVTITYSYGGSYFREHMPTVDYFSYLAMQINVVSFNQVSLYVEKGLYNLAESGRYLSESGGIVTSISAPIIFTSTISNIYCYFYDSMYPEEAKGLAGYFFTEYGDKEFCIGYTLPYLTSSNKFNNALQVKREFYTIASNLESATLIDEITSIPIQGTSLFNTWPTVELTIPDIPSRLIYVDKTYKGDIRTAWLAISNITFEADIADHVGSYNIDYTYTIPDGAGGNQNITLNCSALDDSIVSEHLLWIEFNAHCDVYVYAIVHTDLLYNGTGLDYTINGTISLYRNTELFYTSTIENYVTDFYENQLPWLGPCTLWNTRKLDQQFFGYLSGRYSGVDFDPGDSGVSKDIYFDCPMAEFFTYWKGEYNSTALTTYRISSISIVDPGKDSEHPNTITIVSFKDLLEGQIDTAEFKRFIWWNNETLDKTSIEELLLIDGKTNPRITNFGVI